MAAAHISTNPSASSTKARQIAARQVRLALNVYTGKRKLTLKVLATLCGLPVSRLYQARFRRRHSGGARKRNSSAQSIPNGNGASAPNGNGAPASLGDMLAAASPGERLEAASKVGVATVWDTMVVPLIDGKRESQQPAK
jgi:hypothetical protein